MTAAVFAALHILGAGLLLAAFVAEYLLFRPPFNPDRARAVVLADILYGVAAALLILTGVIRALYLGKGAAYYLGHPLFHAKLFVFLIVGLLSIGPTRRFITWRKQLGRGETPALDEAAAQGIRRRLRLELIGVALIVLLASLMARGIGLDSGS